MLSFDNDIYENVSLEHHKFLYSDFWNCILATLVPQCNLINFDMFNLKQKYNCGKNPKNLDFIRSTDLDFSCAIKEFLWFSSLKQSVLYPWLFQGRL